MITLSNQRRELGKRELTVENLKLIGLETFRLNKKKPLKEGWYGEKYKEVLEWDIYSYFKNHDFWSLWKGEKNQLKSLGFGVMKIDGRYKLYFDVDKINKLGNLRVYAPERRKSNATNPCRYCGTQMEHPALYYYECPYCDFAYVFDPSEPNKKQQVKIVKKRGANHESL